MTLLLFAAGRRRDSSTSGHVNYHKSCFFVAKEIALLLAFYL